MPDPNPRYGNHQRLRPRLTRWPGIQFRKPQTVRARWTGYAIRVNLTTKLIVDIYRLRPRKGWRRESRESVSLPRARALGIDTRGIA